MDSGGAAHEKLDGVVGIHNPSQTDDGDAHSFGHLVHHAQSDGLDARAGKSARSDAQPGASALDVDAHAHEGVDERNAVGALSFDSASNFGDVGDIGGKFDNQGLRIGRPHGSDDGSSSGTRYTKGHAAVVHVGTGDIEFDGGNAV